MICTSAPGKLYVAGEYAVVDPGQPAVLVAVDRRLTVRLDEPAEAGVGRVHSDVYPTGPLTWGREAGSGEVVVAHDARDHVGATLRTVDRLRAERGLAPGCFDVRISSDLEDEEGRKLGLGSSGAVVVALVAALDRFYRLGLTPVQRFQVALLATVQVSPRASGGDLAASTFGGWVRYTAPDRATLARALPLEPVSALLGSDAWETFDVQQLPVPPDLDLLVGWTGSPASTDLLVAGVHGVDADAVARRADFLAASSDCVGDLVAGLRCDPARAMDAVRRARRLLQELGRDSGTTIETERLRVLCAVAEQHGAAAKPSGAGGGDCGVALVPAAASSAGILAGWEAHGIRHLDLSVSPPSERSPGP
ncbi:phosphomevalonate kinase [Ornithinimicrobium avium]|uniref:phosphomevalonate kinase n=1 Tax=Ornithinimicrobium avium TaxID=2283195 RepID=A0A345NIT7_9MICO|nr:phosphomevalonate kinase [Ornithinimicrobium avium]AXH94945.1 phosphomevalonate kinase [Ornithinimicrobium avium]